MYSLCFTFTGSQEHSDPLRSKKAVGILKGAGNPTQKIAGLGKLFSDLEFSQVFVIRLEESFCLFTAFRNSSRLELSTCRCGVSTRVSTSRQVSKFTILVNRVFLLFSETKILSNL